jgi:hypothetical protein
VIEECTAAGGRHPVPRAFSMLAFIAHRRGHDQAALDYLQDAIAVARELDQPGHLSRVLANLSVQQTALGREAEALESLAESARLGEQDGWGARSWPLAAAAVLHLARGQPAIATQALGAYDAHTPPRASTLGNIGGYVGILDEAISATRARLDAADVAAAATAARRKSHDQLIHELIIHVANTSA